jgi:hypothetical protein
MGSDLVGDEPPGRLPIGLVLLPKQWLEPAHSIPMMRARI